MFILRTSFIFTDVRRVDNIYALYIATNLGNN